MYCMNTSIQIPLIDLPLTDGNDEYGEPTHNDAPAGESSTRELLLGLLLGACALVSVHVVWQVALLGLQWLGLLP
jgi:hypothetical protein